MKVIGLSGSDYICQIGHTELEKLTDKYYGNLDRLGVGAEMNLGAGYDFRSDIQKACKGMVDAQKSFDASRATMMKFAVMVTSLPEEPTP